MQASSHRQRNAFIISGSTFILSLLSLGGALQASKLLPSACPTGGVVKCIPSPTQIVAAHLLSQPLTWAAVGLLLLALISVIVGLVSRRPTLVKAKA